MEGTKGTIMVEEPTNPTFMKAQTPIVPEEDIRIQIYPPAKACSLLLYNEQLAQIK